MQLMERSVTKQVRLTRKEASELARLAKTLGKSESDILRLGIEEARAGEARLAARRKYGHLLIRQAEQVPGKNVKFRLK